MAEEQTEQQDNTPQVVPSDEQPQRARQFVSEIKSAEQQIGEHIIQALNEPQTVAVVTTVIVGGDGQQRIVSAALDPSMMHDVQRIIVNAEEKRKEEVPCVGFHCYIDPKDDAAIEKDDRPEIADNA